MFWVGWICGGFSGFSGGGGFWLVVDLVGVLMVAWIGVVGFGSGASCGCLGWFCRGCLGGVLVAWVLSAFSSGWLLGLSGESV